MKGCLYRERKIILFIPLCLILHKLESIADELSKRSLDLPDLLIVLQGSLVIFNFLIGHFSTVLIYFIFVILQEILHSGYIDDLLFVLDDAGKHLQDRSFISDIEFKLI